MIKKFSNNGIQLYSFDIFDTLITRKTATLQGIFAIMQEILLNESAYFNIPLYIRENFYDYRIRSEQYQYSYNECVDNYIDCSFEEIYLNIKNNFGLTEEQTKSLMELELKVERDNIVPIEKNITNLKELVSKNRRVILISDMYHSSEVIRDFLVNIDPVFESIKIYVSNEYKKKKRDGGLYNLVQSIEKVPFSKWRHFGDNLVSDYESALKKRIKAVRFRYPKFSAYEQYAINRTPSSVVVQKAIAISKIAKLESLQEKFKLGSSLAGPILFPYVSWILSESIKKGYKRLYFIARDGYILKCIADRIIERCSLPIETKYIYGSRLAWQKPSFVVSLENMKDVILQYGINLKILSKILDIEPKRLKQIAPSYFRKENNKLSKEQRLKLYNELIKNKEFIALIINTETKTSCDNLVGYLKQELDFSDDKFAFVDLSGSGVTQNCLASVINTFYPKAINSFYFRNGLYKIEAKNVNRFVYTYRTEACALLELLARAPHGQTLGYELQKGRYEPILDLDKTQGGDFENYLNGILRYVENFIKYESWEFINPTIPNYYLDWLCKHIDKTIAEQLGSIAFSYVGKNELYEVAPKISMWEAIKFFFGISDLNSELHNLSYCRSGKGVQKILNLKKRYPSLRKSLIHVEFRRKSREFYIILFGIKISLRSLVWGKERETK